MADSNELSKKVKEVFENIEKLSDVETKEFAFAIRKHPDGKKVYEAYFGYKAPKTENEEE